MRSRRFVMISTIGVLVTAAVVAARRGPGETGARRRFRPIYLLVSLIAHVAPGLKPRVQKSLINTGYQIVYKHVQKSEQEFMNFGYAPSDGAGLDLEAPADGQYGAQLYDAVASAVDLAGKDMLEVGCGRGGGAAFVHCKFRTRSLTGLDLSSQAIALCKRRYRDSGLRFVCGDAEDLPFPSCSLDAVLSVETSHNYPHVELFFREAHRVLRPGGKLLFADLRLRRDIPELYRQLQDSGFTTVDEENITPCVVRALELDSDRRREGIQMSVPRIFRRPALEFAGVEGSAAHTALSEGSLQYLRLVLQKGEDVVT